MRSASNGKDLPPLLWEPLPQPVVIYTEGEAAWKAFDAAQSAQDRKDDRQAMALALLEAA